MAPHCKTCMCDHAGAFPRFSLYYADGSVVSGGGPGDENLVVYALPRSWVEAPGHGVVVAGSEDQVAGLRPHRGMEVLYALPFGCDGGPDVSPTGPETRMIPYFLRLGLAKLGVWMRSEQLYEFMRRLTSNGHVPPQSAKLPFELEQNTDTEG